MARPKSNRPLKIHITLSITKECRAMMDILAENGQTTISEIVESLIAKEMQSLRRGRNHQRQTLQKFDQKEEPPAINGESMPTIQKAENTFNNRGKDEDTLLLIKEEYEL